MANRYRFCLIFFHFLSHSQVSPIEAHPHAVMDDAALSLASSSIVSITSTLTLAEKNGEDEEKKELENNFIRMLSIPVHFSSPLSSASWILSP